METDTKVDAGLVHKWLEFAKSAGKLGARCSAKIPVTFTSHAPGDFHFIASCFMGPKEDTSKVVCQTRLHAHASYPTMSITDARCSTTSTSQLWRQLSLAQLNLELSKPLYVHLSCSLSSLLKKSILTLLDVFVGRQQLGEAEKAEFAYRNWRDKTTG